MIPVVPLHLWKMSFLSVIFVIFPPVITTTWPDWQHDCHCQKNIVLYIKHKWCISDSVAHDFIIHEKHFYVMTKHSWSNYCCSFNYVNKINNQMYCPLFKICWMSEKWLLEIWRSKLDKWHYSSTWCSHWNRLIAIYNMASFQGDFWGKYFCIIDLS